MIFSCGNFEISWERSTPGKQKACAFGLEIQRKQALSYILENAAEYLATYGRIERFDYFVAKEKGKIIGDFRFRRNYPVLELFSNLTPRFRTARNKASEVVDFGGHIDRPRGKKSIVFNALFTCLVKAFMGKNTLLYAQVREFLLHRFFEMGFERASSAFEAPGWGGEWHAVFLPLDLVLESWRLEEFREAHEKCTGKSISCEFWTEIEESIADQSRWSDCDV